MVRAIPVNKTPPKKADNTPKRGRPANHQTVADGTAVPDAYSVPAPFLFPPPPPPPPPPVDNPYYQKFVEQYWQKYDGTYTTLPPMPSASAAAQHPKKAKTTTSSTQTWRPLSLHEEFPINTDRPTYFLGNPTADANTLSEKSCYTRSRLFELFLTHPTDEIHWKVKGCKNSTSQSGRVGLRCVYCASLPHKLRAERAVCYPSSIGRLYHTVADMQHKHLDHCGCIPIQVKETVKRLSSSALSRRGGDRSMPPKIYWEVSARELGMEDIEGDGKAGVRLSDGHCLIRKTASVIERLFVQIDEDEKKDGVVEKREEGLDVGASDEAEKKVDNMDEEVEEILAHL